MLVWVVAEIHQQRCATARQRYLSLSATVSCRDSDGMSVLGPGVVRSSILRPN